MAASARDLGEFTFSADVPIGRIADFYGFPVAEAEKPSPVAAFVGAHLRGRPAVGDGVRVEEIELVVQAINGGKVAQVALELDPPAMPACSNLSGRRCLSAPSVRSHAPAPPLQPCDNRGCRRR